MSNPRIYELYKIGAKITNKSLHYRSGARIIHVSAVSIKQAYYLAYNEIWIDTDDDTSFTGIVERSNPHDLETPWEIFTGDDLAFRLFNDRQGSTKKIKELRKQYNEEVLDANAIRKT